MVVRILFLTVSLLVFRLAGQPESDHYVGSEVCASCHRAIYNTQAKTAMANTWHGSKAAFNSLNLDEKGPSGALHYQVQRYGNHLNFTVAGATEQSLTAPVEAMVGGSRHGISFLLRLDQFAGFMLERPAMIEARYALTHAGTLVMSPGFLKDEPSDKEDELGRVLSPTFETRCVTCHGKPETLGAGKQGGVRCESCHGPASAHVDSMQSKSTTVGKARQQFVQPQSLAGAKGIEVCAQCHNGLDTNSHSDPMPEDVLVSSQVPALRNSECFIQSGEKLSCTGCHNPHTDSSTLAQSSVQVCLGCHSLSVQQHAAICPTNQTQGCIGCHMPSVQSDSFRLTDHWIRVQAAALPGGSVSKVDRSDERFRSQVVPKREFLRLIVVSNEEKKNAVVNRLAKGEPFSKVAHDLSDDPTAPGGGFTGDMALADMDSRLAAAAAHLLKGANSDFVQVGTNWMMIHRLSRDFKWDADRLYQEAVVLNKQGKRAAAIARVQQALDVYPYLLRGLILMGTMIGEAGDANRASAVLGFAAQFYPQDPFSQFDLALTLGKQPTKQIEAFRRAIELDPDMVAAYQSLGSALYTAGQQAAAIDTFRLGLQIDPLSAVLYYDLGLALKDQGDATGAAKALGLGGSLDPDIARRNAH